MTISEWTDNNYQPLKQACVRISEGNPLAEELLHYILSEFLLKTDVHAIILSGGGFFYCLRMATNSWKSTTSPFYRNYRDPSLKICPDWITAGLEDTEPDPPGFDLDGEQEDLWQRVQEAIEDLGWYEQELLKVYAENGGNASLVSRLTKIPRTSINLTIRKIKRHMKQTLAKEVR